MADPDKSKESAEKKAGESALDEMATLKADEISKGSGGDMPLKTVRLRQDRLGERYELKALLGKGGMGVVYRARDLQLNEDIAIKLLRPEYSEADEDINRFKREIKTARRINSDHVIRIHDIGIADNELFISMELLTGGTLADVLKQGRPKIEDCLTIAIGVCDGLAAAHRKGVIHRDLKPHNVLFDENGVVKLVDFGIARLSSSTSHTMGVTGTPHYMSPETADGKTVTTRSDVYSMGVLLFELFTGQLPFKADSLVRLALMHTQEPPPKPKSVAPDIPDEIEQIILKALEKNPGDRFADAVELANELRSLRGISPIPSTRSTFRRAPDESRRRVWPLVTVGVLALGVVGAIVTKIPQRLFATPTPTPTPVAGASPSPVVTVEHPRLLSMNVTDARSGKAIDGGQVLAGDKVLCGLPCGPLLIEEDVNLLTVSAEGYKDAQVDLSTITPEDNKYEVTRRLEPRPRPTRVAKTPTPARDTPTPAAVGFGQLTVTARPWARVYLDGNDLGEVPLRGRKIKAGKHTIRLVQWEDADKKEVVKFQVTQTIEIRADDTLVLHGDMPNQKLDKR